MVDTSSQPSPQGEEENNQPAQTSWKFVPKELLELQYKLVEEMG